MKNTKQMILISMFVAGGAVIGFLETLIPIPFPIPGFRLGISNAVVLVSLILFGFKYALSTAVLKSVLVMLLSGSVTAMFYSLTGALFACVMMGLVYEVFKDRISLIGVSLIGAFFHNLGQVSVAAFIVKSTKLYAYLPILAIIGIFTGLFVGLLSNFVIDKLRCSLPWVEEDIE